MSPGSIVRRIRLPAVAFMMLLIGACTGHPDGVQPVRDFQADRYLGTWYEIARLDHSFERGLTNVTAVYDRRPDGTLSVVNSGFNPKDCAWKRAEGSARFQGDPSVASLSVTFFWPFAGGYHVFALDKADYGWAVVAGPNRDYLWILARSPTLPEPVRADLVARAAALGFDAKGLIMVDHGQPRCQDGRPAPAP